MRTMTHIARQGLSRFWMTGCMALVLLAAGQATRPDDADADAERRHSIVVSSRYSPEEAVAKISEAARQQGLAVVAQVAPHAERALADGGADMQVLVLGAQPDLTPIVQAGPQAAPMLPLKVVLVRGADGGTLVSVDAPSYWMAQQADLPADVAAGVEALPQLVQGALSV